MADSGFLIDGERYEVPRLHELDLDEEQILFDVAGVVQADFIPAHPEAEPEVKEAIERAVMLRVRNPAFKRALAHIAYRRAHPEAKFDDVQVQLGTMNALDAGAALLRGGADEDPPVESSQPQPESEKSSSEPSSSSDSGSDTQTESAPAVVQLAPTGTGR